jgi:hypothetical protein
MLERKGMVVNEKKLKCICREEGLSVRRKQVRASRKQIPVPLRPRLCRILCLTRFVRALESDLRT